MDDYADLSDSSHSSDAYNGHEPVYDSDAELSDGDASDSDDSIIHEDEENYAIREQHWQRLRETRGGPAAHPITSDVMLFTESME